MIIDLNFTPPMILDNLSSVIEKEKPSWCYAENPDFKLQLSTDDWCIYCDTADVRAHITHWLVNQERHSMIVKSAPDTSGYSAIDLPFAMAMLGQILKRNDLISYLKQLEVEFERMKPIEKSPASNIDDHEIK